MNTQTKTTIHKDFTGGGRFFSLSWRTRGVYHGLTIYRHGSGVRFSMRTHDVPTDTVTEAVIFVTNERAGMVASALAALGFTPGELEVESEHVERSVE